MRKDNQTPIHSSSGYLSLCEPPIRWRVADNKCMSSSAYVSIRNLTLPPTHTFSSLFGTVHCPFSPRELAHTSLVHPNPWHDTHCHHKPPYIFPQNSHHTYLQGLSIAFPRYIAMQHPPSHDLIFMSYMLLA